MRHKQTPAFIPDPADQLPGFLATRCLLAPDATAMQDSLYSDYLDYCCSIKQNWASKPAFIAAMEKAGFSRRSNRRLATHWIGVKSKPRS